MILSKIAVLSSKERALLKNSAISRINRPCKVRISGKDNLEYYDVKQHKSTESAFKYALTIVSDIEITAVIETSETAEAIQTV